MPFIFTDAGMKHPQIVWVLVYRNIISFEILILYTVTYES